jgi:hypothetical protein
MQAFAVTALDSNLTSYSHICLNRREETSVDESVAGRQDEVERRQHQWTDRPQTTSQHHETLQSRAVLSSQPCNRPLYRDLHDGPRQEVWFEGVRDRRTVSGSNGGDRHRQNPSLS